MKHLDGEPCEHTGCLNHISHPCENCGRVAGISLKNCPVCGGKAQICYHAKHLSVDCIGVGCYLTLPVYSEKIICAFKKWNNRVV